LRNQELGELLDWTSASVEHLKQMTAQSPAKEEWLFARQEQQLEFTRKGQMEASS
jgi:hypothetical protein